MDPDTAKLFQDLAISLLLGLLVGLQRQRTDGGLAGMRTFALITVLGTLSASLTKELESIWFIAIAFLGVIAVLLIGNFAHPREEDEDRGTTTEVAVLVMFAVGAYLVIGPWVISVVVGAGTAVLLQFKPELHRFAGRIGDKDLRAIMQFVLITCIILPVLPNETYGPLGVLNPFEVWLMVVLIVGISLGGYILYKFLGHRTGVLLGGLVGGAISSTATTVSYARQASGAGAAVPAAAVAIMVASTMLHVRVLVEMAVVSPALLAAALGPVAVMLAASLLPALVLWLRYRNQPVEMPEPENPTQMKTAVVFGMMYALVLLALAFGREHFDEAGLFVVAGISGLTDMDAITLSTARMTQEGRLEPGFAWRLIVVALLSNFIFKGAIVAVLGSRRLLKPICALFSVPLATGVILMLAWPAAWQIRWG